MGDAGREPSERILVVEHDPRLAARLSRAFRRAGYRVEEAVDGWHAFQIASTSPPRAVVLSASLPHDSTTWFCTRITALERLATVPVVLVTEREPRRPGAIVGRVARALEGSGEGRRGD